MTKKIFTLLTALVLSIGIGWAADFSYSHIASSYMNTSVEWTNGAGTVQVIDWYWNPDGYTDEWVELKFIVSVSEKYNYGEVVGPAPGTYNTFYSGNSLSSNPGCLSSNSNYACNAREYNGYNYSTWSLVSGTVVVEQGKNGMPYVDIKLQTAKGGKVYVTCGEQLPKYAVSADCTTGGYISSSTGATSGSYAQGSSSPMYTAYENSGYYFDGWYENNTKITSNDNYSITNNGKSIQVLNIQSAHTIEARFYQAAAEATITTSVGVGGTVGGATGKNNTNNQYTITATANPGYAFAYWEDANHNIVSNNASYTFTLMADVNYTAIFYADGTITANSNNTDWGTVTGSGSYAGNTQVTLTATPKTGYGFIRWSDNNTDNPRTITVDGDFEVTAIFDEMIVVNLEEGTIEGNKSSWCTVTGSNSEYDFSFNFDENFYSGNKNYTTMDRNTEYSWVRKVGGAKRQIQEGYVVSIDFNTTFRRAVLNAQFTDEDGQKYQVRIITNKIGSTNWYDDVERYNGYPSNMGDGNMTFSYGETDVTVGSNYLILSIYKYVSDDYGSTYQAGLFFNHSGEIKSGVYPIQGTANSGTMTVGGKDGNGFAGTWAHYECGVMFQTGTANWLLRSGTVTLKWKDQNHYYAVVDAYAANGQHITFKVGREADVPTTTHKVTFKNDDGTVLQESQVEEGVNPAYEGETPTKDATEQYVYTFTGWNDGTTSYAKDATLPAVGSNDVTYTATFSETTRQYAVTINAATNGTIKVMNGNTEVHTGDKVDYGTVLTVTATPSEGYHLEDWIGGVEPSGIGFSTSGSGTITVEGAVTIGATFAINTYTLTIGATENGTITMEGAATSYDGKGGDVIENIPYGTHLTFTATADQGYQFITWTNEADDDSEEFEANAPKRVGFESVPFVVGGEAMVLTEDQLTSNPLVITIDGDLNLGAMFEALPPFTVTIHETYDGYISVSDGVTTVTNQGGAQEVQVQFPQNTQLTLTLHPDNSVNQYVDYGEWMDENYETISEEQVREITLTEDMDLYADFMMGEFTIYESGSQANYDAIPKNVYIRRVTLVRTFKKSTWSTMCLPFDSYVGDNAQLTGKIHEMFNAEVVGNNVDVYFNRVNEIKAGYPYMYYSASTGVTNPVFDYVIVQDDVTSKSVPCGDMTYCGILTSFTLPAHDASYRYISSNKLYYPSKDYTLTFDRGYFKIAEAFSGVPIRMFVEDSMIEEADQPAEVGTQKYISDGILIIERNAVKYNAQGQVID